MLLRFSGRLNWIWATLLLIVTLKHSWVIVLLPRFEFDQGRIKSLAVGELPQGIPILFNGPAAARTLPEGDV
jgi:hypothetical protein